MEYNINEFIQPEKSRTNFLAIFSIPRKDYMDSCCRRHIKISPEENLFNPRVPLLIPSQQKEFKNYISQKGLTSQILLIFKEMLKHGYYKDLYDLFDKLDPKQFSHRCYDSEFKTYRTKLKYHLNLEKNLVEGHIDNSAEQHNYKRMAYQQWHFHIFEKAVQKIENFFAKVNQNMIYSPTHPRQFGSS